MAEHLIRALVVEDDLDAVQELQRSLADVDAEMVASVNSPAYVPALVTAGVITPSRVDVVFLNHRLRTSSWQTTDIGGEAVLNFLNSQGFLRSDTQEALDAGVQTPNQSGIVVVGSSLDASRAGELATFSCNLDGPLIVDWAGQPLQLGSIIQEVRYLKPANVD